MFGVVDPKGDGFTNEFLTEAKAVEVAEKGLLVFYISKSNEPDAFLNSFDTNKE